MKICFKHALVLIVLFTTTTIANAQLPAIEVVTAAGRNIISWVNPYGSLAKITVQRSADSTTGYVNIGTMVKPKKGANVYSDDKPLAGKNCYQLIIAFNEEVEWYSKRKTVYIDSAVLAKSMLINTDSASKAAAAKAIEANPTLNIENSKPVFTYTPSNHIYTNTFTGHVNIKLEDAVTKRYSLVFFDTNNKEALRISRISYADVVLDKHNFNGRGTFSFKLFDDGTEVEKGYVEIN